MTGERAAVGSTFSSRKRRARSLTIGCAERRREIDLLQPDRIAVRIGARDVARLGQSDQRMAQDQRQRVAADDIADLGLRLVRAEGQLRRELGILREDLHEIRVGGAELGHELEVAAAAILDRLRDAGVVAREEAGQGRQ